MLEEIINNQATTGEVEETTQDYITAIKELKQNSVDRSKYDKLVAENKKLLNSIVNGQELDSEAVKKADRTPSEIRKDLFENENNTNLEYVTKALELREVLMKSGQPDPFLPIGEQILPTDEDVKTAEKVAQVLQECVDYASGDSQVFTNELQRRLVDVKIR